MKVGTTFPHQKKSNGKGSCEPYLCVRDDCWARGDFGQKLTGGRELFAEREINARWKRISGQQVSLRQIQSSSSSSCLSSADGCEREVIAVGEVHGDER